jgi:hypothetical protein
VLALGGGPAPLPNNQWPAAGLAAPLRLADSDPQIRAQAAALATRIQAEDGVATAVAAVNRYLLEGPPPLAHPHPLIKETAHAK